MKIYYKGEGAATIAYLPEAVTITREGTEVSDLTARHLLKLHPGLFETEKSTEPEIIKLAMPETTKGGE